MSNFSGAHQKDTSSFSIHLSTFMTDLTIFVAVFIFSSFIKPEQPYISISLTESYKQYHAVHIVIAGEDAGIYLIETGGNND